MPLAVPSRQTRHLPRSDIYRAIADPVRRRVLDLLVDGERSVTDLVSAFDITQPAISQHLRVLRDTGLVERRALGRRRMYRLDATHLREVADWLTIYEKFWTDRLDRLGQYLDRVHGPSADLSPKPLAPGSMPPSSLPTSSGGREP